MSAERGDNCFVSDRGPSKSSAAVNRLTMHGDPGALCWCRFAGGRRRQLTRTDSHVVRWVDRAFAVIAAMLTAGMLAAALGQVSSSRSYPVMIGKAKASVAAPS